MTPRERKLLRDYLRWMANELGLRDWTVTLSHEHPKNDDAGAEIACVYGRKRLTVKLMDGFEREPLDAQRHYITHELIHAHLCQVEWAFNNLGDHLPLSTFQAVWGSIKDNIEYGVDGLADVIAPRLPLPQPKPKRVAKKAAVDPRPEDESKEVA